jgi:hypothetical protein
MIVASQLARNLIAAEDPASEYVRTAVPVCVRKNTTEPLATSEAKSTLAPKSFRSTNTEFCNRIAPVKVRSDPRST